MRVRTWIFFSFTPPMNRTASIKQILTKISTGGQRTIGENGFKNLNFDDEKEVNNSQELNLLGLGLLH